ncbi:MAG: DNA polymerase III subunit alpha [Vallitalea sp.]|jgi:DNA polymerase-3 subunit alpha|nr:DNA polymerase III subunit alpha [Vallitalea sp.]
MTQKSNQLQFTHLHVHTEYSLLDGSSKIKELIAKTKELGMDSIAITDHGVMYGVIDFYRTAKDMGVKPIIGCEVYVAARNRKDKDSHLDSTYYHLVLLAENDTGYNNLMKLVSIAFIEGFYYKPRIDLEILEKYSEGIIGLSACLGGHVQSSILNVSYEKAKEVAIRYNNIFGHGNFYLELQDHGYNEQKKVNQELIRLSKETNIPLVATNDIHYTLKEDYLAHDILLCIQTNKKVNDEDRMRYKGGQFYLKSPQEMYSLFPYAKEALQNTYEIAKRCNVDFEFGNTKLPKYSVPEGYDAKSYLRKICEEGLINRYIEPTNEVKDRLEFELSVIEQMGYVDYFLIVWDFIKYARDNDIMVGPGRGSAAGSIVAYSLKITDIDPITDNLLFERFLNPERVSMPDIDIDFCYERRQEVIDYVVEKYGEDKVAQIITFGTMAARAVIRDVGRAIDLPYAQVDKVAKMIPQEIGITISKALKMNSELSSLYEEDEETKHLIDMSMKLEGLPRHSSTHAAGVVICQEPVMEYVPLNANDGAITTQFPMTTLEELGLLKMDFLGLRTLTVIQNAVKLIENRDIHLDMNNIDYNDQKVYELIGAGKTEGVFQLESAGMKSFMKELKPSRLEDIIAGVSLYRPGPMDFIPKYIKGKNHPENIEYTCEELEPILQPTYGCIVYQEQVMQIVRDLAGYTLGRSDLVRRAMSKKKAKVMEKERQNFIYGNEKENVKGCINNGIDEKVANKIYDEMIDFAKYAFNKSHAAAYSVVTYQTAWLKRYYPVEFMAALLTSVMYNSAKVSEYIGTCRTMGIELLPPDVNEGYANFSVSNGKIRYGLAAIKNVGKSAINSLVIERKENGKYINITNFCERLSGNELNKRMIESLIKAGAFDSLKGTRKQYMQGYKVIMDSVIQTKKRSIEGQINLFDFSEEDKSNQFEEYLPHVGEFPEEALLNNEKEVLGIYLSGHPLQKYEEEINEVTNVRSIDFIYSEEDSEMSSKLYDGQEVIIGGMITAKTIKSTRNNKMMAFITLEDLYGSVEVIIFPNDYERNKNSIIEDAKIYIKGRVSLSEEQDSKIILQRMIDFRDIKQKLYLKVKDYKDYNEKKQQIIDVIRENKGDDKVIIYLSKEKTIKQLQNGFNVNINDNLINKLKLILTKECVKVKRTI